MNLRLFLLPQVALVTAIIALAGSSSAFAQPTINATAGRVAVPYSYTVVSSATGTVVYSATGLPPGLGISSALGTITGTPTLSGNFTGSVSITDSNNFVNSATIVIPITAAAGTPSITSAASAAGTVGTAFTVYAVTATVPTGANGVTSFNIGSLPPGLTVGGSTLAPTLVGTPTAAGSYSVALSANSASGTGATTALAITVAPALTAPVITGSTAAAVPLNGTFSYDISASNNPTAYEASGLPAGLELNTGNGQIRGTASAAGVSSVTLRASNASGAGAPFALTITVGALPVVTSPAVASVNVGMPFSYASAATNSPTSFNIGNLPAGLVANTTTGLISGTPSAAGTANVAISANNITGTSAVVTLAITIGNAPAITSSLAVAGTVGSPLTYSLTASNSPTAFTVGALPSGLTYLNNIITGTPASAGTTPVTLSASNATGAGPASTVVFTIAAAAAGGGGGGAPVVSLPTILTGPASETVVEGASVTLMVFAAGSGLSFQWYKDDKPITGAQSTFYSIAAASAASAGSYYVNVANTGGSVNSAKAVLAVSAAPIAGPTITAQPLPVSVSSGGSATLSVAASGPGPLTYQWRKDGTAIPGATSATLTLSGVTAGQAGNYSVVVTNAGGSVTSGAATLSVGSTTVVAVAPVVSTQPISQTASLGGTLTLSVVATGTAPVSYQWSRGGVIIAGATSATLALTNLQASDAAAYTVAVSNAGGTVTSNAATVTLAARSIAGSYFGTFGGNGGTFSLLVRADRTGVFLGFARAAKIALVSRDVVVNSSGRFRVSATSAAGSSTSSAAGIAAADPEYIIDGSIAADGAVSGSVSGLNLTLSAPAAAVAGVTAPVAGFYQAGATGASATSYTIIGAAGDAFVITVNGTTADAGKGTVDASGAISGTTDNNARIAGTVQAATAAINVSVTPAAGAAVTFVGANNDARADTERFFNISSRSQTGTAAGTLIVGFVIAGDKPKPVLVRAVGPTLGSFGVNGALSGARLEVFKGSTSLAVGNDWGAGTTADAIAAAATRVGAFALPANSKDAALLLILAPGDYSAVVTGQAGATGIGLVEVYDATVGAIPRDQRIVNLSTRAIAGNTSDTILIAGFVVTGSVPKRVLIRGVGPALTQFGVAGALARPSLAVFSGNTVLAQNAGWTTTADTSAITAAAQQAGAFAFAATSQDAALILNLPPGSYTAQISGVAGTTGVALVEVYELP